MFIKNYNDLTLNSELKQIKIEVVEDKSIYLVDIPHRGYVLYTNDNIDSNIYLLKTDISHMEFNHEDNAEDKKEFIAIVDKLISKIYDSTGIKEFERKHPEYVFLQMLDMLNETKEYISSDDEIYNKINDGFLRIEIAEIANGESSNDPNIESKFKNLLNTR